MFDTLRRLFSRSEGAAPDTHHLSNTSRLPSGNSVFALPDPLKSRSDEETDLLLLLGGLRLVLSRTTPFAAQHNRKSALMLAQLIEHRVRSGRPFRPDDAHLLMEAMHDVGHLLDPVSRQILKNLFSVLVGTQRQPEQSKPKASAVAEPTAFLGLHEAATQQPKAIEETAQKVRASLADRRSARKHNGLLPTLSDFMEYPPQDSPRGKGNR